MIADMGRGRVRRKALLVNDRCVDTGGVEERSVLIEEYAAERRAFDRLPDSERELLELRLIAGLTSEETAHVLGRRPGAVRMAQSRALSRLRAILEEESG